MVLHHAEAGRLHADTAVAALQRRATADGAEIWHNTEVTGLRPNNSGVRVLTHSGSMRFDHVVVAAGAWTSDLVTGAPALARELPALTTTQEQPVHFIPTETPIGWPSFIHHPGAGYSGPGIYGLASEDGIKVGEHGTGPVIEPATRDFRPRPEAVERLRRYAARLATRCRRRLGHRDHVPVHHDPRPPFRSRSARTGHACRGFLGPRVQVRAGDRRTGCRTGRGHVRRPATVRPRQAHQPAAGRRSEHMNHNSHSQGASCLSS